MITIFNYYLDREVAIEVRRSQNIDTPTFSRSVVFTTQKTKDALRTNKQCIILTKGLPKCCEAYGNGVFVVSSLTRVFARRYTTGVTFSEGKGKQLKT